jgi:hypothetical protein
MDMIFQGWSMSVFQVSTPEQKCIGSPEQKYINDVGKSPPNWEPFVRYQAWLG